MSISEKTSVSPGLLAAGLRSLTESSLPATIVLPFVHSERQAVSNRPDGRYPALLVTKRFGSGLLQRNGCARSPCGGECVFAKLGEAALPTFYAESRALGFRTIEISDNTVPLTPEQRRSQIMAAVASGLIVFGEVGSKETMSNPALLVEQAELCLEAGAQLVLVEAAELVENGRVRRDSLDVIKRNLPADRVMIELPGPWINGVRSCDIEEMKKILFAEFGPDVNLANIAVTTIYDTEAQRVGLGTGGPLHA